MILEKLKSRKTKHVTAVRDHILYLHRKISKSSLELTDLEGRELKSKVKKFNLLDIE